MMRAALVPVPEAKMAIRFILVRLIGLHQHKSAITYICDHALLAQKIQLLSQFANVIPKKIKLSEWNTNDQHHQGP
jgi:hypothetical protein